MAKSRTQRGDKEFDQLERLKHENTRLKRENSRLKKLLARADLEQYENLSELVKQQRTEERQAKAKQKAYMTKWKCHACGRGHMKMKLFPRRDGIYYYRQCSFEEECGNRTKLKKHHEGVEES